MVTVHIKELLSLSLKVREWLKRLGIVTTHLDRIDIDHEIERQTGNACDTAIAQNRISESEFLAIVERVKGKRRKVEQPLVA